MFHRILPFLVLLSLLAACATPPESPVDAQARHAARLYQEQQYESAADLYLALAGQATGGKREYYRLMAADSLLQAGNFDKGAALLDSLDAGLLEPAQQQRLRLLQARVKLERQDPRGALALLEGLDQAGSGEITRRALALRARALTATGDTLGRIRTLIRLERMLPDEEQRLDLQMEILSLLVRQPPGVLRTRFRENGLEQGWAELAALLRSHPGDAGAMEPLYQEWRALFPDHPALPMLLPRWYAEQRRLAPAELHHVAVLLPAHGPFAGAAEAIRAGLLAAWYADGENRPLLTFHDSSDPERVWPLLNQVAEEGADLVIGPLAKNGVLQLARAGELPLPVLALNQVSTDTLPPPRLYQYSLSPEQEARQVALYAAGRGLGLPGVLYPDSPLGERLFRAFQEEWLALGRGPIRVQLYHPAENDYSDAVAKLLGIPEAKAEHARLEEEAGEKLPFEPEMPVDFVFIIGGHSELLRLRPLVLFHHGTHLPVMALSRTWKGQLGRDELFDLRNTLLPEIPWLLPEAPADAPLSREQAATLFPDRLARYPRLIAMGMDAYALLTRLNRLAQPGQPPYAGQTGALTLDERHVVQRRLTWINLGDPVKVLGPTPSPEEILPWEPPPEEPETMDGETTNGEGEAAPAPAPR